MARPAYPRPTDGELEILSVLWAHGPSTVRQAHRVLLRTLDIHHNSVLKTLQIMLEKGLVTRDDSVKPQVYAALAGRAKTERHLLKDLMDRVFGGSVVDLVMRAASTRKASAEEIREIRERLKTLEDQQ